MRDFLNDMQAPVRGYNLLRRALNAPSLPTASEVAGKDRIARQLGATFGMVDAGGEDAAREARAMELEKLPVAEAWTAQAEENVAFLNEDQQALADVYDSLTASGILSESDIDRESVTSASGAGDDVRAAWERGRLQNLLSGYGLQFTRGEYENLDELREKIRETRARLQALQGHASDALGVYGAVEQLPRILGYDMPMQATWAAAGATAGGLAGSAVPGAGTLAGAGAGGVAGGLAGTLYSAWHSEEGAFAADMLLERDDAGQYLDEESVRRAATAYGGLSGLVETGGEALTFKLLGPVLQSVKGRFGRRLVRDAVKQAAAHQALAPIFRSFAGGAAKAGAIEGGQEFVQEGLSAQIEAMAKNMLSDAGTNYYRERQAGAFSRAGLARMAEAGLAAAKIGPWFYALPGGVKVALDTRAALRAGEFAAAHKDLADKVAASKTRELSPARMESYLQTAGLDGDVLLPADAVWALQQSGTDIATPLGWDLRDMEEAAALGHDIVTPAARLQAYLPPESMKAVADIMREAPQAMNATEAANLNGDLPADLDGLVERAEEDAFERSAVEGELDRLRGEIAEAVKSAPRLMSQIAGGADPETSVGRVVDNELALLARRAQVLSRLGVPVSETLSRISFQGLVPDEDGRRVTPEEAESLAQRRAVEEADAPFWDEVWGRLDADSLKRDFPDARRELALRYGRGLFARRGEGLAVDELADELKSRGLLDTEADSSALVERLKEMERPRGLRRNAIKGKGLFHLSPEDVRRAEENLARDSSAWREAVEQLKDGAWDERSNMTMLHQTPLVLQLVGAKNLPVEFSPGKMKKAMKKHDLSWELIKKLPEALADPVMVFKSASQGGDLLLMLSLTDKEKNGATVNVPVALELESTGGYTVNMATTVFGRRKEGRPDNRWFIHQIENGNLLYQHHKKSRDWARTSGLQLPGANSRSVTAGKRIFTEADLVKLREEHPGYYHLDMERLEREGLADERMRADLDALDLNVELRGEKRRIQGLLQEGKAMETYYQTEAENKLQRDVAAWEKAVDGIVAAGNPPSSPVRMLAQTPLVLDLLGKDTVTGKAAATGGIHAAPHLFDGTHPNMTPDMWKQLPAAMADPIAVFDSDNAAARAKGDLVFMLELTDADGATVVVPVALDSRGKLGAQLNIAKSAYAKEANGIPSNGWFIKQAKKNARYINGQKWKRWNIGSGANSPLVVSNASGNRIFTEGDLVKLKSAHPGYYHGPAAALGSTTPDGKGNYVVQLFAGANLSTLFHESAHVFFLDMERLEREGLADERMRADLAALREWTAALDDDAALKAEYDRYMKDSVYGGAAFEDLADGRKEDVRARAKQEMLARGFEQYLREGRAPTSRLEGVFARFRKWLMRVYKDALALNVALTDEVRDVFDRMLAHEEEMDLRAEEAEVRDETARMLDALGLKGAKRLELQGLIAAAKNEAAEKLRRVRDAKRDRQRREWAKEAREQVKGERVYVARKALRVTPVDLESLADVYGEELGKALMRKLPGSVKRGGAEPESFAAAHGYESAAAMVRDIVDSPTPGERVKQLMDERQAEHDALFDAEGYLFEQDQLAEQQEKIASALEAKIQAITAEQRYRREVAGETVGGKAVTPTPEDYEDFGRMARWRVGREQLRAQARTVLDKKPMGEEILPEAYRRAASRWMREERRAILGGRFDKALEANYKARINIELARLAAERRDWAAKLEKSAKKFLDLDKADSGARFAVFWLSQNMGLFKPTRTMLANAADKGRDDVNAFFRRMRDEGHMGPEDIDAALFTASRPWKDMVREKFRPYAEAIAQIIHMERESRTLLTEQGRVDARARAEEIAAGIYANNAHREPGALEKRNGAVELLKKFHAAHLKADTIALLLDGDAMGPAWRAIVQPINEATWTRVERLKRERDALRALFSVYSRRELVDMKGKRVFVPELNASVTREQALAVLLNSGNESNLQRVMAGQNLTADQVRAVIDVLDERDVRFAQSVWDYFETFRKESFDLEESLTGVRPETIKARPVPTRFGLLRGGHYPVVYDRELSVKPVDTDKIGTRTGGMFPAVDHGSMKQRTATGLGTPLSLSLDVIPSHVSQTVHMLAFRRPVIEVAKVLRRKEVNGAIQETAGVAAAKALDDWLRYVAGERPGRNGWDRAASWARKNAALYTMGFKLSTMLAQVTGLLTTVSEIGLRWTLTGVAKTYATGKPLAVFRSVAELSPMMANRIRSIDRDVFEVSSRLMDTGSSSRLFDPFVRMKSFMETHGFVPMGAVQMFFADLPTWNGAYAKALAENGGDVKEAVLYADAVVERTQVGGAEKDLAAVQRGRELGKLMTMFYSYFSALYNLSARRVTMLHRRRDAAAVYRLATLALLTWFAEPVLMGILMGKAPDDEDDGMEDWLAWGVKEAAFNPFNMLVGVREVASMVDSYVSGYGGRYRLSSALDVFDSAMRFGAQVGKAVEGEGDGKKLALTGGKALGQATGLVNEQEMLALEVFWNWLDGTTSELELGALLRKGK